MGRVAQIGIALGALGGILVLMGLFPGITGLKPTDGIGIVQIAIILVGFAFLMFGALMYVKFTFYEHKASNLAQQIGTRLALTGLLFAALSGLSDVFGFGSHSPTIAEDYVLGSLQTLGIIGSFIIASFGVLIYAVAGQIEEND